MVGNNPRLLFIKHTHTPAHIHFYISVITWVDKVNIINLYRCWNKEQVVLFYYGHRNSRIYGIWTAVGLVRGELIQYFIQGGVWCWLLLYFVSVCLWMYECAETFNYVLRRNRLVSEQQTDYRHVCYLFVGMDSVSVFTSLLLQSVYYFLVSWL